MVDVDKLIALLLVLNAQKFPLVKESAPKGDLRGSTDSVTQQVT